MVTIERTDIPREPQYPGIMFGDGQIAKVISMIPDIDTRGVEVWKMVLYPSPQLVRLYNITIDKVDQNGLITVSYPRDMLKQLSPDPSFPMYFCFLNFKGQEAEGTKFMKGYNNSKEMIELRGIIKMKRAENAYLTEQLEKAKTNIRQFVKEEIMGPATELNAQVMASQMGQVGSPMRNV